MATFDRNGFVILNNLEEAFASSKTVSEGGLPYNHVEDPDEGLNPLGESIKAALRAAAAEKRAARRVESAVNAQRLFKLKP